MSMRFGSIPSAGGLLTPTGDPTGLGDSELVMEAYTALPSGYPAKIGFASNEGPWNFKGGVISIPRGGITLDMTGCYVKGVGAGDMVRMYDSSTYGTRKVQGGGIIGDPIFDLTAMNAGSSAFHAGDIFNLKAVLQAQNFTQGNNPIGMWADNQYYWTEELYGRVSATGCREGILFDNSANLSGQATGSFDRAKLTAVLENEGLGDGIVFSNNNTPLIRGGKLTVLGNFAYSSVAAYSVFKFNAASSYQVLGNVGIFCSVELDGTGTFQPATIIWENFSWIQDCFGMLDFSDDGTYAQSNNAANGGDAFQFHGSVYGDPSLTPLQNLVTPPGSQAISANASTISTNKAGVVLINPGVTSYTGTIMQPGFYQGERITLINIGTGSITFAASGTSNVADGVSDVIAANVAATYIYNTSTSLWYRSV